MLLDDRDPADPPVVCERLIIGRHKTNHFGFPSLPQNVEPQMPVKKVVGIPVLSIPCDNRRLDDPHLAR